MSCDSDDPVYEIAYAEAVRALSEQLALVEGIRSRAGLLLSAGAVTTSFLGAQALGRAGLGALAWMALAGFCATAALCLVVLAFRSWELGWQPIDPNAFQLDPNEPAVGIRLRGNLALRLQGAFAVNQRWVERLGFLLQLACAVFAADASLWLAAIALS